MGKTIARIKLWNVFDEEKVKKGEVLPIEVDAQIDNGATSVVLSKNIIDILKLQKSRETKVKYADGRISRRDVFLGLRIEILGRSTECEAILEPTRDMPLVGQFVLEMLDLWIDSKNGKLIPNPESPDIPMLEEI